MWRLTRTQYRNSIAVLFNGRPTAKRRDVPFPAGLTIPLESVDNAHRFKTYSGTHAISDFELRQGLMLTGDTARRLVIQLRADRTSCLGPDPGKQLPLDQCVRKLIEDKGAVLFRRPLTAEEAAQYTQVALGSTAALGADDAVTLAFQTLLVAPQFLFRSEVGTAAPDRPGQARLDPYEVATALAFGLTDWPADDELWAAARAGELVTETHIRAHIARLLTSMATLAPLRAFAWEYFELENARNVFKNNEGNGNYSRGYITSEAGKLIEDALATNGRKDYLKTLLTTNVAFYGSPTFKVYGLPDPSLYDTSKRTVMPENERAGLLTHPAFIASFSDTEHSLPVKRGRFVNESLLCRSVPDLPIGVIAQLPPTGPGIQTRDRLAQHSKEPACAVCHKMMDAIGLSFEMYEHWGKLRTTEAGKPIDTAGVIEGAGDADGRFGSAPDLARRLAASRTVERCFVRHNFRFWLGRDEQPFDGCAMDAADKAYASSGGDYLELLSSLFTSVSFLYRSVP